MLATGKYLSTMTTFLKSHISIFMCNIPVYKDHLSRVMISCLSQWVFVDRFHCCNMVSTKVIQGAIIYRKTTIYIYFGPDHCKLVYIIRLCIFTGSLKHADMLTLCQSRWGAPGITRQLLCIFKCYNNTNIIGMSISTLNKVPHVSPV